MFSLCIDKANLRRKDNCHDNAVYCNDLAENDRYQVLCSYSRCLDAATQDRGARDKYAPVYYEIDALLSFHTWFDQLTMLLLQRTSRCIDRCLNLPKQMETLFLKIARPLHSLSAGLKYFVRTMTHIESLAVASEE